MTEYTTEPMSAQLTGPQTARLGVLRGRLSATTYTAERDEPHDEHLFISLYRDGRFLSEHIIDADGTCCDGMCDNDAS